MNARAQAGGRISLDTSETFFTGNWVLVAPNDYESNWRTLNLDAQTLDSISPAKLLTLLADLSPEVSRGLWDFLRLCNPGYEIQALQTGADEVDDNAQAALDAFLNTLRDHYGALDIVFGRLFMGAFIRGAFAAELVLDRRGRMPLDLATPDPASFRFRGKEDPERGLIWQAGQWQASGWVAFDRPTVRYLPVDPFPGSPYGRPMAAPALFSTLFLLGMLHDLKRVVQQQGYPRLDLSIDTEKLAANAPGKVATEEEFNTWTQAIVEMVQSAFSALEPDDAYIHTDVVSVNRPVGTVDASSLSAVDSLIAVLERMATRALKSMPLMMGITDGASETESNRQWEIHAAGIKSIQHYAENLLERLFQLALEAQGIQARVQVRFAELRAAERLRDAQAETLGDPERPRQVRGGLYVARRSEQ